MLFEEMAGQEHLEVLEVIDGLPLGHSCFAGTAVPFGFRFRGHRKMQDDRSVPESRSVVDCLDPDSNQ